jgi:hypothetical protein
MFASDNVPQYLNILMFRYEIHCYKSIFIWNYKNYINFVKAYFQYLKVNIYFFEHIMPVLQFTLANKDSRIQFIWRISDYRQRNPNPSF